MQAWKVGTFLLLLHTLVLLSIQHAILHVPHYTSKVSQEGRKEGRTLLCPNGLPLHKRGEMEEERKGVVGGTPISLSISPIRRKVRGGGGAFHAKLPHFGNSGRRRGRNEQLKDMVAFQETGKTIC